MGKIVFFVEPAKYSLYLSEMFHKPFGFKVIFHKHNTSHHHKTVDETFLSDYSVFVQWWKIFGIWQNSSLIIANGYTYAYFIIPFMLNHLVFKKVKLAIESDTMFSETKNKGLIGKTKRAIRRYIFTRDYVFGLAGGRKSHMTYFSSNGMKPDHIFLAPMISLPFDGNNELILKNNTSEFVFLFVGRIVPVKNIQLLIEAFLSNFREKPGVLLRIVGDGTLLKELTEKYSCFSNIVFTGSQFGNELEEEYLNADVFVLPSLSDQWGLVVNEALSHGLPVIASSNVGAAYDLIEGRNTGIIFQSNNQNDLEKAMNSLYKDKDLRNLFSKNAYILMKEVWNAEYYKKSLLYFLNEIQKNN